jgi:branched-chain amino acid transport system permease protein
MTTAGWPLISALAVTIVLCFTIGWMLGYPALRVQHHYLAFVTLSFSTLAWLVFRNEEWLTKGDLRHLRHSAAEHLRLLAEIPLYSTISASPRWRIVSALDVVDRRSPWGRAFMALRENPTRALSLGVDTRRYTLMAFAIGSAMGGFAGALYAPLVEFIDPNPFALGLSLSLLLMVIVGGSGFFFGPFLGALIAVLLPEWLRDYTRGFYLIAYALVVMACC